MDNSKNTAPYKLIVKQLSGQATQEELRHIEAWLNQDPKNQKIYDELKKTWINVGQMDDVLEIDLEEEWRKQNLISSISGKEDNEKDKKLVFWRLSKIAAVFLVLLAAAATLYLIGPYFSPMEKISSETIKTVDLPDGSVVTLNTNSTLKYPAKFGNHSRNISLQGEAFLEIRSIPDLPFIITAGKTRIEVLGTSFNVKAYEKNREISVVVSSGKVAFYPSENPEDRVILESGNTGIFIKAEERLVKRNMTDPNFMAWKTKKVVFEDETLSYVAKTLEEVYHTSIKFNNPTLKSCRITASFDQQSLNSVMKVIGETLEIEIKGSDKQYTIDGKECE